MDITKLSDNGLKSLHLSVKKAVASDEERKVRGDNSEPYYGVYEFHDWKIWRDTLEAEMTNRKLEFESVIW